MADNFLSLSDRDIDALSRIVAKEAGNQSEEGQRAVFYSILNRAASGQGGFPGTVQGVIEQSGQYEPMRGRSSWEQLDEAPDMRPRVLGWVQGFGQAQDPTGGATFFQNEQITNARNTNFAAGGLGRTAVIGDHSFYDRYGNGERVAINPYGLSYNGNTYAPGGTQVAANVPSPTPRPSGNPLLSGAGTAYLARNPDVASSMFAADPLAHYSRHGQAEGRIWDGSSSQAADPNADYLSRNADVAGSKFSGNPYEHYVNHGQYEGRVWNGAHPPIPTARPEPIDPGAAYLARNVDVAANGMDPASHYLTYGVNEGRSWDGPAPIPTPRPVPAQMPNAGLYSYGNTREIYQPQAGLFGEPASPYLDGGYNGFSASQGGGGFTPIPTPRPQIGGYAGLGNVPIPTSAPRVSGYTPPALSTVPIPTTAPRIAGYVGLGNAPIPTARPTLGGSGLPSSYSGNIPVPTPRPTR